MHCLLWVDLFRRIPAAQQDSLVVVTAAGAELMVQKVLRLENDFVLVRARLAGSNDPPRIVVLPYEQIGTLAINKVMLESEVEALFGAVEPALIAEAPTPPVAEEVKAPPVAEKVEAKSEPVPEKVEARPPTPPPPVKPPAKPSKSILLARLRARLAGETSGT